MTLREYSAGWLVLVRPTLRPSSARSYESALRNVILPTFGDLSLDEVTRPRLKVWFSGLLGRYTGQSAGVFLGVMRVVLASAVEDELLRINPASGLRRALRVIRTDHEVEALRADELRRFLAAAREGDRETYVGLLLLAMTGLRVGEAAGLQWGDLDFSGRVLHVRRQRYEDGTVWPLKSKSGRRTVDMAGVLRDQLAECAAERRAARERYSIALDAPSTPVLFPDAPTGRVTRSRLGRAMRGALQEAGLSGRRSLHTLRHTYASLLLQRGESPQYVQRQLGHASIAMTCDVYGRWLPIQAQHGGPDGLLGDA